MTQNVQFHLDSFDGPLDLLLQLIHKNKVSIYDIPISEILEQYMQVVNRIQEADMDTAGDFISMASQLMLIKSKMLLPKNDEQEQEDPRAQLVEMLLEYQRIRQIQPFFRRQAQAGADIVTRPPEELKKNKAFEGTVPLKQLIKASQHMFDRLDRRNLPPPTKAFEGIVGRERVPVHTRIAAILMKFRSNAALKFASLFESAKSRSEIVATFLAVLELSKNHRITIDGDGENAQLKLREDERPEGEKSDG